MTYEEATGNNCRVSRTQVKHELARHGATVLDWLLFVDDMGDHGEYDAAAMLRWLGY